MPHGPTGRQPTTQTRGGCHRETDIRAQPRTSEYEKMKMGKLALTELVRFAKAPNYCPKPKAGEALPQQTS